MRLCYNSLLGTIVRFYRGTFQDNEINKMLLWSVDDTFERADDVNKVQFTSELYVGRKDIKKDLQEKAESAGVSKIISNVSAQCSTLLAQPNIDELKDILTQLVIQSSNVDGNDVVLPSKRTTKNNILNDTSSLEEFLGNLIYYVFVNALNKNGKKTALDSRNGDTFSDAQYRVLVSQANKYKNTAIDISELLTIDKSNDFNNVFTEVANPNVLHSKTPNQFKLYCLDVDSDGFNYNQLKEFIIKNLNTYIYSRQEIRDFLSRGKVRLIGIEALKEIKKFGMTGDELGHILLYSYLECVLKAPKLFSHFEAAKGDITTSGTIHIAYLDGEKPQNQVIIGSADIQESLCESVEKALQIAQDLKSTIDGNFRFIDSALFNKSLSQGEAQKIKNLVIPNKTRKTYIATGYGIFVGYKVSLNPKDYDTPEELANALQNNLLNDINNNFAKIEEMIKNHGLDGRSIYLYILPFNDPTKDKDSIIEEATSI